MQLNSELLEFQIGNNEIAENMSRLPAGLPFDADRLDFLNEVSRELLSCTESKRYSDVVTFAFWIRRANMEKEREVFCSEGGLRIGRGVVFHIAPSNVAVNYAYSFAVGFVLGNAGLVRLPSRKFVQADIINGAIQRVLERAEYQKWEKYLAFFRYKRNSEINDYLSSICDVRVIWGGDETIHEIRKSELKPRAGEITFADRYSICVLDAAEYLHIEEKDKVALDFYNDTYLTDQNACTSPRLVCWIGGQKEIPQAKEIFWEKLWELVAEKYVFQPIQFVDKLTNLCLAAVQIDGGHMVPMKDNRIVRIELEEITPLIQEYRGDSGFFYEYDLKDVMELGPVCNDKLQTVAILGDVQVLLPLIQSGVKGIDRVVKIGHTMDFDFLWDGYDLRERLTRVIQSERNG